MPELLFDEQGFTCECGLRNNYPDYVKEHWDVRLVYTCSCTRKFVLFHGKVRQVPREMPESSVSDAFGD